LLWLNPTPSVYAAGLGRLRRKEEEMSRKTAVRGIPSLIFVLGLTLAGASPAAAAGPGFRDFSFDRLFSGFWGEVAGWLTGVDKRGFGLDPNGGSIAVEPEPPGPETPPAQANPPSHPGASASHGRP
jgi:hypothetical protein